MLGVRQPGHQDDLRRQVIAERFADRESVRRRDDQVEEHDVRVVHCGRVERFAARPRRDDGVAFVLEPRGDEPAQVIGIVDDEDPHGTAGAARSFASGERCQYRRPDPITVRALVVRACVFVTGRRRFRTAPWAPYVHKAVGVVAAHVSGRYGRG